MTRQLHGRGKSKGQGQFYTPAEVSRVMAQVLGIAKAQTSLDTTVCCLSFLRKGLVRMKAMIWPAWLFWRRSFSAARLVNSVMASSRSLSRAFVMSAYYNQAHEMLFEAHARAFAGLCLNGLRGHGRDIWRVFGYAGRGLH